MRWTWRKEKFLGGKKGEREKEVFFFLEKKTKTQKSYLKKSPHVVVDVRRQVEVDHVRDVRDVEPAGRYVGRDQDGGAAGPKALERHLALLLRAVSVDRGGREAVAAEEVLEGVGAALGLNEDQGEPLDGVDEVEQDLALVGA